MRETETVLQLTCRLTLYYKLGHLWRSVFIDYGFLLYKFMCIESVYAQVYDVIMDTESMIM